MFARKAGGDRGPSAARFSRRRAVCLHCRKLQTEREGEFQTAAAEEGGKGEKGEEREAVAGNLQNATAGFAEGVDELAPREWISLNSSRRRAAEVLKHRERGKASTASPGFVSWFGLGQCRKGISHLCAIAYKTLGLGHPVGRKEEATTGVAPACSSFLRVLCFSLEGQTAD